MGNILFNAMGELCVEFQVTDQGGCLRIASQHRTPPAKIGNKVEWTIGQPPAPEVAVIRDCYTINVPITPMVINTLLKYPPTTMTATARGVEFSVRLYQNITASR